MAELSSLKSCFLRLNTPTAMENPFQGHIAANRVCPVLQVYMYSRENRTAKPAQDRSHHKVYSKHTQNMENLMQ